MLRRQTVRTLASVMIWIGGVELFASFLTKIVFDYTVLVPYSPIFVAILIVGFAAWILANVFGKTGR
ncbi:MAG: hypothetical protein WCC10_11190 [Tumebacillaceae bacterium]